MATNQTEVKKPKCKMIGTDGNVFALIGVVSRVLKKAGQHEEAKKMAAEVFASSSYHEALCIMMDYVEPY